MVSQKQKEGKASKEAKASEFKGKNKGDFHSVSTGTSSVTDQAAPSKSDVTEETVVLVKSQCKVKQIPVQVDSQSSREELSSSEDD